MSQMDTLVKGGIVVSSEGFAKRDIGIKDGMVQEETSDGQNIIAKTIIDAEGKYVLPGIIDAHNHPVYADRLETMSAAAVMGGTTTMISYVGAVAAWGASGNLLETAQEYVEEGENSSVIDFGLHGALTSKDLSSLADLMPELIELGLTSFKAFMAYAKRGMKLEDGDLLRAMEVIGGAGGLFCVHAENGALLDFLESRFVSLRKTKPKHFALSAPNLAEAEAVLRIATLASAVPCPLYIVHLSARESLDVLRLWHEWEGSGRIYVETCPHYLTLSADDFVERGSLAKVGPPLRERPDQDALWRGISQGEIDVVGSDFAGQTMERKRPFHEDIFDAPSGLPGIGDLLVVLNDAGVNTGRIQLTDLVRVLCENPAKIFGLYPRKGVLLPGSDADLVVWDPSVVTTIRSHRQGLRTDYNLYEGRRCLGFPALVMQRGKVLVEDGELKASAGQGRYLRREIHNPKNM